VLIFGAPSTANAGIPATGFPVCRTCSVSSSDNCWTSARVAILGPRSLPRLSKPWHVAQTDSNVFRPSSAAECPVCFFLAGDFVFCALAGNTVILTRKQQRILKQFPRKENGQRKAE